MIAREKRVLLLLLGIVLAALAAFSGVLGFEFVRWDDPQLIYENPLIRSFSPAIFWTFDPELYVPTTLLTFQIEHALFGFHPAVFHFTNLLLHLVASVLAFFLLRRLSGREWLAFACAILFAVHPLHAEAVSWVSARKDLLMTVFALGSLLAYLKDEGERSKWFFISLILFLLALTSKVTALMLPLIFLLLERKNGEALSRSLIRLWPFFAFSLLFGVIAFFGKRESASLLSPIGVLVLSGKSLLFHVHKLLLPFGLSPIYRAPEPITLVSMAYGVPALLTVVLTGFFWVVRRRLPDAAFGMAFFLLMLLPSFLAYQKTNDITLAADRYSYLPSIGFLFAIASLIAAIIPSRLFDRAVVTVAAIIAALFLPLARAQSVAWKNTESLFTHALAIDPASHIAHNNLGFLRLTEGEFEEAALHFGEAVRLKPEYPDALVNIAVIHGQAGQYAQAQEVLKRALAIDPNHAQAHFNLGGVHQKRGEVVEATLEYEETIRLKSTHIQARLQIIPLYLKQGRREEARKAYEKLLNLDAKYRGKFPELEAL